MESKFKKIIENTYKISDQWVAGFFDGEGSLWIQVHHGQTALRVSITQADIFPLELIQKKYGGKIKKHTDRKTNKVISKWSIENTKDSILFLRKIYPYLIVKKIQVNFAETYAGLPWRQFGKGGKRIKLTQEEKQMDEMMAYSIKMGKIGEWDNYDSCKNPEEIIDFVFKKVCEKFKD